MRQLEPRVMRVLACLVEQAGAVVERDVLLEDVWRDVVVNEDALTRAISELRKALGDDPSAPQYIETVRGRGYRLVAPVWLASESVGKQPSSPPASGGRRSRSRVGRSVAVAACLALVATAIWLIVREAGSPAPSEVLASRPFTSYPGYEIAPALSPDGRQVVYAWGASYWDEEFDLYVKQEDVETPLRLTDFPGFESSPSWSPDGRSVAFGRFDLRTREAGLYTVSAIGGPPRRIVPTSSWIYGLDWSPDGGHLVFSERATADVHAFHVVLLSLGTSERIVLTHPPTMLHRDHSPVFSPDGRTVAFIRSNPVGSSDVYLVASKGGPVRRLTRIQTRIRGLDWTSDGRYLLFLSHPPGTSRLWRVSVDDGSLTRLPSGAAVSLGLSVAADRLVIQQVDADSDIWRLELSEGSVSPPERVVASTRWDGEPSPSPDGERIAFVSTRSGEIALWLAARDGRRPVRLASAGGLPIVHPRWSPTGTHIAFNALEDGRHLLFIQDTDGGQPERILDRSWHPVVASWSRDGQWIYFASDRTGSWEIWKVPFDGGTPLQVTQDGGFSAFESTDGTQLYYTKPNVGGLWRRPTRGGSEKKVLDRPEPSKWDSWGVTDSGIYFTDRVDGQLAVYTLAPEEQRARVLARLPTDDWLTGVVLDKTGSFVLFARETMAGSDLVLLESLR